MARTKPPTRRAFLQLSTAGVGAIVLPSFLTACGRALGATESHIDVASMNIDPKWIRIRRPDDLVVVDFGLVNLKRATVGGEHVLVKGPKAHRPLLVARLPPQHLLEHAAGIPPSGPVPHLLADGSRIVFVVDDVLPIPLTTEGLLDACTRAGLNVSVRAAIPNAIDVGGTTSGSTSDVQVHPLETMLEVPYGIALSPNQLARFSHTTRPRATASGRIPLWQTRLGVGTSRGSIAKLDPDDRRTMRALEVLGGPAPVTGSLSDLDRQHIVTETSAAGGPAIRIDRLALSALGASLDATLEIPQGQTGLLGWRHRTVNGRDVFVRVVSAGVLTTRHTCAFVEITERRLSAGPHPVAYLHHEQKLVVTQEVVAYHDPALEPQIGSQQRRWPFSSVRLITRQTPPLDLVTPGSAFVPTVDGVPFAWQLEATDRRGEVARFEYPLCWVPAHQLHPGPSVWPGALPDCRLDGQRIALAEPDAVGGVSARDATTYEVRTLRFRCEDAPLPDVPFFPVVDEAEIVVEAMAAISKATGAVPVRFNSRYTSAGFGAANPHAVFLEVVGTALRANFLDGGTDKIGGLVAPNLDIAGLSRVAGPVARGVVDATTATLQPAAMFPIPLTNNVADTLDSFCPRLFGCITLSDILSTAGVDLNDLAPKFVTEAFDEVMRLRQVALDLIQRASTLYGQLHAAATAAQNVATEIYQHAVAVRDFFDSGQPAKYIKTVLEAVRDAIDRVLANPELELLDDTKRAANRLAVHDALERIQALDKVLADAKTDKVLEYIPQGGTLLRTARRVITAVGDTAADAQQVFAVIWDALEAVARARKAAKDKTVKVDWRPKLRSSITLKPGSRTLFALDFESTSSGEYRNLLLSIEARAQQRGNQKAGADVLCSMERFKLSLFELLELHFKRLQFRQRMGRKPEIDVVFTKLVFTGELAFIQTLQDILPSDGFSDPPAVIVDARGLDASYTLALPNVAVGMFSLENMKIGARLVVPFLGDAIAFKFQYSRRESPFLVTVALLGGGGYFELVLTPAGLTALNAAIQFGARLSADIGVASGSLQIMGGFAYEMTATSVKLAGFLRMRGECDVLGLVSASIELYLSLEYESTTGKLKGRARIEIEVSVAFFSITVPIETERTFAGANGDPTFDQLVSSQDFVDYCGAFAA